MKQNMKEAIGLSLKRYNDTYMKAANDRIDNIVSQAGTDNTEIVDARIDSAGVTHTTLNNRILAETKMNDQHLVSCSGEYITAENTMGGSITNLEVLGNTIQNEEDLADIKSVGELQEDGTYKMSILSCGKNLASTNNIFVDGNIDAVGVVGSHPQDACNVTDFIKVKPNTNYIRNIVSDFKNTTGFYDANKSFISRVFSQQFTTPSNCMYVRVKYDKTKDLQIEEGTVATEYEPYQGNKCDILLPCQLEKVGDVSDRLYYDDIEKVWCIEKNVESYTITNYSRFLSDSSLSNVYRIYIDIDKNIGSGIKNIISSIIPYRQNMSWLQNEEGCYTDSSASYSNRIWFHINKSKISGDVETYFKNLLPVTIEYQTTTPQKIVLPLSTQIALNSFFGTTHVYMESGEVEGTIKCKIPKSLGATVQSLNNKTDILSDRIEAIEGLKDSQNMKYETDKGYLVCKETKNGVIDDLKIEGKTLVNKLILSNKSVTTVDFGYQIDLFLSKNIIPKGVYYVTNYNDKRVRININRGDGTGWIETINFDANSTKKINVDVDFFVANIQGLSSDGWNDSNKDSLCKSLIITETIQETGYFEGLMSVGQDVDEIEVLSRKEDGNLFGFESKKFNCSSTDWYDVQGVPNMYSDMSKKTQCQVYLPSGTYTVGYDGANSINISVFQLVSIDEKVIVNVNSNDNFKSTKFLNEGVYTIRIRSVSTGEVFAKDVQILKGTTPKPYTPHQSDKKQILFYNSNGELEPVTELHEWDSIEKHSDNKWDYHKRSGKVVLNGSENWSKANTDYTSESNISFSIPFTAITSWLNKSQLICNLLPSVGGSGGVWNGVKEGVTTDGKKLFICINKTKLTTQDVEGFKQWLQANNLTVLYLLAQEEVYELAPLHLDSYANETLILCNSGAISPKMEFSITSHINELVKAYGERINLLEEKVYKYMVTQNRMQLASTYSADSVTFKVDYFSLCGDEENYDEDLYNLILNNILVGKDNYNYDKMFTIILDYASWNQISWEQFDILVGLMDMQHNPPVEELPTEDEIEEDIIEEETPVE